MKKAWDNVNASYNMKKVWLKLKNVNTLKSLHSKHFAHAHLKMEEFRRKLTALQALQEDVELQQEEKDCYDKLRFWSRVDESILRQTGSLLEIPIQSSF